MSTPTSDNMDNDDVNIPNYEKVEKVEWFEPTSKNLIQKLEDLRDLAMADWALLINDPKIHGPEFIEKQRHRLPMTAATLMEHDVKLELPKKDRGAEDVLKEAAGELGAMYAVKGVASSLSFMRKVREEITTDPSEAWEEVTIYQRDDGSFYYIYDDNEVECDEEGNDIEAEEEDDDYE